MRLAWRIARAELAGGLGGFRILLACLALGVAAIAAVGTLRDAIARGLNDQGAVILGGDAELRLTYRSATAEERAWIDAQASRVSEIVDFRSMAVAGDETGLTQVKAVDDAYPLVGAVTLDPAIPLDEALAGAGGVPGAVMDPILAERMGLTPGATFRLGETTFRLGARLLREPDSATAGLTLGPRTIVRRADLAQSGLIGPGTLYETNYRVLLPPGASLPAVQAEAEAAFDGAGMRWADRTRAAPGVERFVDRMAAFLVLVGLAGLVVGGVGVSSAVGTYLDGKTATIATLRTLGAESRLVFRVYLLQIGVLAVVGIGLGLLIGLGLPTLFAPLIEPRLPFPAEIAPSLRAGAEAALYGALTALLFALWPLSQSERVRAAALYRAGTSRRVWPRALRLWTMIGIALVLLAAMVLLSGTERLALYAAAGMAGSFVVLLLCAAGLRRLARRLSRGPRLEGRPILRTALAAIGAPKSETTAVVLSLGLGLTVLAGIGQIDANLRSAIDRDLPERAPAFFFIDIQNDQIDAFKSAMSDTEQVSKVESAAMLRGVVSQINGRPAAEVAGGHWVVEGDRGLTYSDRPPEGTEITAGEWWPEGYDGPPQLSFAAEEAMEMGLKLGDRLVVNVLGRDIEATITSFREVDFSTAGIGFVMSMSPNALRGAPHTHIATVYAPPAAEAAILKRVTSEMPNVTAIGVRDAIDRVTEALDAIATATAWAAAVTLATGFVVLIGAAAAGERSRVFEAAVLKTLGATRGTILASFALRAILMGAAAGAVAILAATLGAWAILTLVMDADFTFEPVSAIAIVLGGMAATLGAGLLFALRPLRARPAGVLRSAD